MNLKVLNYSLINVDRTESTNTLLKEIKNTQSIDNGTIVLTNNQTNGRGQKGNEWVVKPGLNLTFSVFIEPKIDSQKAFYLNIISSLAVYKSLQDLNIQSEIKWPNDILVDGKKIAGILVENQLSGKTIQNSIIGIGLNVNQLKFEKLTEVTSVALEINRKTDLKDILKQTHGYLDFYLHHLMTSNFNLLEKHYLNQLFQINQQKKYRDVNGEFLGEIMGINKNGLLIVKKEDQKTYSYDIQEIKYL